MAQLLTLSRAAQLLGVARGVLQKQIREGALPACDGMVAGEDLLRLYPDVDLEESGAFERMVQIKEQSFGRRVRERMLPSQEILAQRLYHQSEELADLRRHLARYHDLVVALRARLEAEPQPCAAALAAWLDAELADVLGSAAPADALVAMDAMLRVMSAHVTVKPSGHEFFVEGNESILKAALRAGLNPNYGCGNGNCGLCKGRVVAGEVRQVQHCDYALSAAEKAQNYVLLCAHTAVGDLTVDMPEAGRPEDIPTQEIAAQVRKIAPLGADTLLLHIQTPRSGRLRFLAGQGATLGVAGGTADFGGDYAIASCPCDERNLLFHIPRDDADEFATRLFAGAVKPGDPINVRGPWGDFVLDQDAARPLWFVCCDTGFAAINSLVEHALAGGDAESISLWWAATRADGHYLANQCRAWADAIDNFSYLPFVAADPSAAAARLLSQDPALPPDWSASRIYLAGPAAFVDVAAALLRQAGAVPERLYTRID